MFQQEDEKRAIRQQYLDKRRMMSKECWTKASAVISASLLSSQFYNEAETLLIYVSAKDNEVDTNTIIDCALESGRNVLVPVVVPNSSCCHGRKSPVAKNWPQQNLDYWSLSHHKSVQYLMMPIPYV